MDYRVSYEHSLASAPDDYVAELPSQVIEDVPRIFHAPFFPSTSPI